MYRLINTSATMALWHFTFQAVAVFEFAVVLAHSFTVLVIIASSISGLEGAKTSNTQASEPYDDNMVALHGLSGGIPFQLLPN